MYVERLTPHSPLSKVRSQESQRGTSANSEGTAVATDGTRESTTPQSKVSLVHSSVLDGSGRSPLDLRPPQPHPHIVPRPYSNSTGVELRRTKELVVPVRTRRKEEEP